MLKLIPFQADWLPHETLDVHAIYRRPVRDYVTGELIRDEHGFVQWDLTSPLPIRSHQRHAAKGFEYVTLADTEDVVKVSEPGLVEKGVQPLYEPRDYLGQNPRTRGPWDATQYLQDMRDAHAKRVAELERRVAQLGAEAAEEFERQRDPEYVLPERYRRQGTPQVTQVVEDAPPKRVSTQKWTDTAPKRKRGRPRKVQSDTEAVPA